MGQQAHSLLTQHSSPPPLKKNQNKTLHLQLGWQWRSSRLCWAGLRWCSRPQPSSPRRCHPTGRTWEPAGHTAHTAWMILCEGCSVSKLHSGEPKSRRARFCFVFFSSEIQHGGVYFFIKMNWWTKPQINYETTAMLCQLQSNCFSSCWKTCLMNLEHKKEEKEKKYLQ